MSKNNIDLSKIFNIERVSIFLELDDDKYKHAICIPEIQERLLNSCKFAGIIPVVKDQRYQCGLVRASIAELVSLEELPIVRQHNADQPFRLHSTEHPLLCIIKELRNLQLHLSSVEINGFKKNLLWGRQDNPEDAIPITKDIFFISNLEIADFISLRNYKRYDPIQFKNALAWFDTEQKKWGIAELLTQASYIYAQSLSNIIKTKLTSA